ncbi:MAG: S8 family serine peptidase [Candidatus Magasanikbacteria bacterium]|nr:S8 family serine peptidase [Candidatus Magasanikbacteria bacterium]
MRGGKFRLCRGSVTIFLVFTVGILVAGVLAVVLVLRPKTSVPDKGLPGISKTMGGFVKTPIGAATPSVKLESRVLELTPATTKTFLTELAQSDKSTQHVYVRLARYPQLVDRDTLEKAGVTLLDFLGQRVYMAVVSGKFTVDDLGKQPLVEALAKIEDADKAHQDIWKERFFVFVVKPGEDENEPEINYVQNSDGTLNLTVEFFADVAASVARNILQDAGGARSAMGRGLWEVKSAPASAVRRLAAYDAVKRVDPGPAPFMADNNRSRAALNVDTVQNFTTATNVFGGLSGLGVQAIIFESMMDETHDDFSLLDAANNIIGSRVARHQPSAHATHGSHATHVAGIVGGNGFMSTSTIIVQCPGTPAVSGTPWLFRGMAPQATLLDYASWERTPDGILDAVANFGTELSNNSYSITYDGDYSAAMQINDRLIRGSAVSSGGVAVPGRSMMFSAGNHGSYTYNGGEQVGYFALTKQNKNDTMVGNWNACGATLAGGNIGTSMGPAYDGRIKPDVVASGSYVISTQSNNNGYTNKSGTSMATPAVTGVSALVLQQYATTYGVNLDVNPPRPSTIKAVLVNTATDIDWATAAPAGYVYPPAGGITGCAPGLLNNPAFCVGDGPVVFFPGPDFATGWGMVNAQAAVNAVAAQTLFEDQIDVTGQFRGIQFSVASGTTNMRMTLAWDDVEGSPAILDTSPHLVNDLDLELTDPAGVVFYPWQLNQAIADVAGVPLPNEQQYPGTGIVITTALAPTAAPIDCDGSAADPNPCIPQNDYPGTIPVAPAGQGRDHLNNVEQVFVSAPVAGTWNLRVTGFQIPDPANPQPYSIAGLSAAGNAWPDLTPIGDVTIDEGATMIIPITAVDPEGTPITLTASGLPPFAAFADLGGGAGTLTLTPSCTDTGVYRGLAIIATDGGAPIKYEGQYITITVNPANCAPAIDPVADVTITEGDTLDVPVSATDPEGDALVLAAPDLPPFAAFAPTGPGTGAINLAPSCSDAGVYADRTITATDSGAPPQTMTELFTITVDDDLVPVANAGADIVTYSAMATVLNGAASSDPEAKPLTYSWAQTAGTPVVLAGLDTATPSFTAPTVAASETLTFTVTVTDSCAQPAADTVVVTVRPLVDASIILDRSGSMMWPVPAEGGGTITKMNSLKNSVNLFLSLFVNERPGAPDKLGIVKFADNTAADTQTIRPLADVEPADIAPAGAVSALISGLTTDATTWIRGGLNLGLAELFGPAGVASHKKAMVLFSDGKENESPLTQDPPPAPDGVLSDPDFISTSVYAVGFGVAGAAGDTGIDEALLTTIQNVGAADGFVNVTAEPLALTKFFVEALATMFDQTISLDPVTTLSGAGSSFQSATISSADRQATFVLTWNQPQTDALDLKLRTPEGELITTADAAPGTPIEYVSGATFKYFIVRFPLTGRLRGIHAGTWQMEVSRNQAPANQLATFATAVMVDSPSLRWMPSIPSSMLFTGDEFGIRTSLLENGKPIANAKVFADIERPIVNPHQVVVTAKLDPRQAYIPSVLKTDPPSPYDQKLLQIIKNARGKNPFPVSKERVQLFDDGKHNDGKANDGTYGANLTKTNVGGVYRIHLRAQGKSSQYGAFTRESSRSITAIIKASPKASNVTIAPITKASARGTIYQLTVTPKDSQGNIVGAGYASMVKVSGADIKPIEAVEDKTNGSYTLRFTADPRAILTVRFGDEKLASMVVEKSQ